MFKLKSKTTFDLALGAVDLMDLDLDDLVSEKEAALSIFQATEDRLGRMNDTIAEKIDQCTSLIATLSRIREELETQLRDNSVVRGKILDLMGVPVPGTVEVIQPTVVLDDKSTLTGGATGADDFDTAVEE